MKVERKGAGTGRKKKKKPAAGDLQSTEETAVGSTGQETAVGSTGQERAFGSSNDAGKFVKVRKTKTGKKFQKEEVRDRSGAVVEEGEALFQGFRVTKEDQKRLQTLYRVRIYVFALLLSSKTRQNIFFFKLREKILSFIQWCGFVNISYRSGSADP
jgi:hypothetical protein